MSQRIVVLNTEDSIRRNASIYFGSIGPHPVLIASRIAEGALVLGCKDVSINFIDGWWLISGSSDWLKADNRVGVTEDNAFEATWALPELGDNCFRSEIFARVYSDSVMTATDQLIKVVKGSNSLASGFEKIIAGLPYTDRVVGFRFSSGA